MCICNSENSQFYSIFHLFNFVFVFLLFQDPQEQLSEESSAFDKNETNAFRENSMVVEAIRPYLTNKSSSPSAGFGGELRPAFNLAFADSLTSKWTIFFYAENSTKVSFFWDHRKHVFWRETAWTHHVLSQKKKLTLGIFQMW